MFNYFFRLDQTDTGTQDVRSQSPLKLSLGGLLLELEPFNRSDEVDRHQFIQTLKSIVEQNRDVFLRLSSYLEGAQITDSMIAIRQLPMEKRKAHYVESRISEQRRWYAKKSAYNKRMATKFFIALIVTNAVTVCFAIVRVRFPSASYWPTDVLVALALGLLSWMQTKRYSQLAGSYALAAHEIGFIKEQSVSIKTEEQLTSFVKRRGKRIFS